MYFNSDEKRQPGKKPVLQSLEALLQRSEFGSPSWSLEEENRSVSANWLSPGSPGKKDPIITPKPTRSSTQAFLSHNLDLDSTQFAYYGCQGSKEDDSTGQGTDSRAQLETDTAPEFPSLAEAEPANDDVFGLGTFNDVFITDEDLVS